MQRVAAATRKGGKIKAHKRKKKGGGVVMVKSSTRKAARVSAHSKRAAGKGRKVRNSVGTMVYAK